LGDKEEPLVCVILEIFDQALNNERATTSISAIIRRERRALRCTEANSHARDTIPILAEVKLIEDMIGLGERTRRVKHLTPHTAYALGAATRSLYHEENRQTYR
jgi:hypothetical protein